MILQTLLQQFYSEVFSHLVFLECCFPSESKVFIPFSQHIFYFLVDAGALNTDQGPLMLISAQVLL